MKLVIEIPDDTVGALAVCLEKALLPFEQAVQALAAQMEEQFKRLVEAHEASGKIALERPAADQTDNIAAAVNKLLVKQRAKVEEKYSDERVDLLAFLVEQKKSWDEICVRLNRLPGGKIASGGEVMTKYYELQRLGRIAAVEVKPAEKKAAVKPQKPVVATMVEVEQWAAARGLCNGGADVDLAKVNAKRQQLGLAPFEVKRGRR